jgi:hypothetical protein
MDNLKKLQHYNALKEKQEFNKKCSELEIGQKKEIMI